MRRHFPRLRFLCGLQAVALLACAASSFAHPMGNFSISHYAGIRIERGYIELRYILDEAEIPTFQEMQRAGIVPKVGDPSTGGTLRGITQIAPGEGSTPFAFQVGAKFIF